MLITRHLANVLRAFPFHYYDQPFVCNHGWRSRPGSISSYLVNRPWRHHTAAPSSFPDIPAAGALYNAWLALTPAQRLAWAAVPDFFSDGYDAYLWTNAAWYRYQGDLHFAALAPTSTNWLPLFDVIDIHATYDWSGVTTIFTQCNSGSDYDDVDAFDRLFITYSSVQNNTSYRNYHSPSKHYDAQSFPQANQPQFNSFIRQGAWIPGTSSYFGVQIHAYLRDGRHALSNYYYIIPTAA